MLPNLFLTTQQLLQLRGKVEIKLATGLCPQRVRVSDLFSLEFSLFRRPDHDARPVSGQEQRHCAVN